MLYTKDNLVALYSIARRIKALEESKDSNSSDVLENDTKDIFERMDSLLKLNCIEVRKG